MNDGQEGFSDLRNAPFRDGGVKIVLLGKTAVAAPVVGDNRCAGCHGVFDETAQRLGASIWDHGKPKATAIAARLPFIETATTLTLSRPNDIASGKARIAMALPATENAWMCRDAVRLSGCAATRTDEPIAPASMFKIGRARCFIRNQALKLRQRARKRQIASLKHIDCHNNPKLIRLLNILPVVGVCDNRISPL